MPLRAPRGFIDETDAKVAKVGHPAPPWMSSYADLMTELVCFFVILYALSAALNKNVQNAAAQVKEMMDKGQMKGDVKIDKDGLKITLEEQGGASFFGSGAAEPTPEIDSKLALLVPSLRKLGADHEILVEGHTDNQQIHNMYFDSNWELSTARATSVTRLLIEKYGIPANHIGAVGYGDTRPIVPNDTPEDRAKNRRVVFFIKGSSIPKAELAKTPPAPAAPPPPATATAGPPAESVPPPGPVGDTVPPQPQPQAPTGGR
ncbi:MAG: flagellar motor protein MotB [Elusimicrobia bacterium]|nr:flagellar motor protein MotB [Elusimicrobiota bacterium]MDE2510291.1 flagellar motor protein MotB [Elusimicrobiota bacterium]